MRASLAVVIALVLLPLLAGCADDDGPTSDQDASPQTALPRRLAAGVPAMAYDPEEGVAWWETFAPGFVKRDALLPANAMAAEHIADSVRALGLEAEVREYPVGVFGVSAPVAVSPLVIHVVVGVKRGTDLADHAIALGGHYDTVTQTLQGAYDNGAGTATVYATCAALAKLPLRHTLLCLFFDAEELGLVGSRSFVADSSGALPIDFYLGFDMTGMNWPGYPTWKLYNWVGDEFAAELFPLVDATLHDVLGWPEDGAEAFDFNDRSSDEISFASAHIPTIRFAGGRTAGVYDQYHMPGDTVEHVYDVVGGRDNFVAGFGAVVENAYTLAAMLDQTSLEELSATYAH